MRFLWTFGNEWTVCTRFARAHRLAALPIALEQFTDTSQTVGMAELMIPAASDLIGKTAVSARFRTRYQLSVIGLKRGTQPIKGDVQHERLQLGDTLLVAGPWKAIHRLESNPSELIVLHVPAESDEVIPLPARAPFTIAVLALMLGLMVFGVVPNVVAGLFGCFLLGLFRCIDVDSAYRSIQWPTVFLIVGMLPFSTALQKTGGVDLAVQALTGAVGDASPIVMLAALYAITALLGLVISNTATAVLMAPVAISLATELGQSPHAFAMAVVLASSAAFLTPVSSPVKRARRRTGQLSLHRLRPHRFAVVFCRHGSQHHPHSHCVSVRRRSKCALRSSLTIEKKTT